MPIYTSELKKTGDAVVHNSGTGSTINANFVLGGGGNNSIRQRSNIAFTLGTTGENVPTGTDAYVISLTNGTLKINGGNVISSGKVVTIEFWSCAPGVDYNSGFGFTSLGENVPEHDQNDDLILQSAASSDSGFSSPSTVEVYWQKSTTNLDPGLFSSLGTLGKIKPNDFSKYAGGGGSSNATNNLVLHAYKVTFKLDANKFIRLKKDGYSSTTDNLFLYDVKVIIEDSDDDTNKIASRESLTLQIDKDSSNIGGTEKFSFTAGDAGTEVANINESGDLQIDGDLTVSGNDITFGNGATIVNTNADLLTIAERKVIFTSATMSHPVVELTNTANDATGPNLRLVNDRGSNAGEADDVAGRIDFFAKDAAQDLIETSEIVSRIKSVTNGEEGGSLTISVAEHDGGLTAGLVIEDGDQNGELDVTIGAGAASLTTVTGALTVSGGAITGNGSGITTLNASNISSGTINNSRLPATVSVTNLAGAGASITSLNASSLSSGTLPNARLPNILQPINIVASGDISCTGGDIDSYASGGGTADVGVNRLDASTSSGDEIGRYMFRAGEASDAYKNLGGIVMTMTQNMIPDNSHGCKMDFWTTPDGASANTLGMSLSGDNKLTVSDSVIVGNSTLSSTKLHSTSHLNLHANSNMYLDIDDDGNTDDNFFAFRHANTNVATLNEHGLLVLTDDLYVRGGTIYGTAGGHISICADTDMYFDIDDDEGSAAGNHKFIWRTGNGNDERMTLDEAGRLELNGKFLFTTFSNGEAMIINEADALTKTGANYDTAVSDLAYSLIQNTSGKTYLNSAAGQSTAFRIGNTNELNWDGSSLSGWTSLDGKLGAHVHLNSVGKMTFKIDSNVTAGWDDYFLFTRGADEAIFKIQEQYGTLTWPNNSYAGSVNGSGFTLGGSTHASMFYAGLGMLWAPRIFIRSMSGASFGGTKLYMLWDSTTEECYYRTSTRKVKKDIVYDTEVSLGLEEIKKLKPVRFTYKSDNCREYGLIAEDVYKISPELVSIGEDFSYDENGKKIKDEDDKHVLDSNDPAALDWNERAVLVAVTSAIKELDKKIETLKTENEQLKARIEFLEKN